MRTSKRKNVITFRNIISLGVENMEDKTIKSAYQKGYNDAFELIKELYYTKSNRVFESLIDTASKSDIVEEIKHDAYQKGHHDAYNTVLEKFCRK